VIVIGLTGSVGMGKSTTAAMFREAGVPVHDSDEAVRQLYAPGGGAVGPVGAVFPGAVRNGAVDREALRQAVLDHPDALNRLNAIVHPLVAADREAFLARARQDGAPLVVLDIPLLFETGGHQGVDAVVVVSAPAPVQRERVLSRPGMTPARLDAILAAQMDDVEKRDRADFVIDTSRGLGPARQQVAEIIAAVSGPVSPSPQR